MKHLLVSAFFIVVIFTISFSNAYAQCSDGGVCSVGGHSLEQKSRSQLNISASYKFGSSGKDDDVKYHSFLLGAVYNIFEKTSVQMSIPYNIQSGALGGVSGIGDLIVSVNQNLFNDDKSTLDASVGVKLATGEDDEINLPMSYQPGLGSNDFIFALNYSYNQIGLGVGYQLAGERNENYIKLKRGDDLLVRASYNFLLDKFTITPQLLFIKRLGKSNTINLLVMGPTESYIDVEKSDQTQINLLTQVQYKINNNYSLFTDFAIPFIKREVNVDGLTRSFSASLGIQFSIN
ncbi:MAG: hypothetical protein IPH97_09230 [Ignavibacteriales bacterium]|nr:hypothetical protein [Ignavibacteriales bacterium]